MNKEQFGKDLKQLRKRMGITQEDVGKLMDVDPLTISRWERGTRKPMPVHLRKIERIKKKNGIK